MQLYCITSFLCFSCVCASTNSSLCTCTCTCTHLFMCIRCLAFFVCAEMYILDLTQPAELPQLVDTCLEHIKTDCSWCIYISALLSLSYIHVRMYSRVWLLTIVCRIDSL